GRWVTSVGKEVIRNPLNVTMLNIPKTRSTNQRDDVVAERGLVAAGRARLVEVAGPGADATRLHSGDELLGGLLDGRIRRRPQGASMNARLRLRAPRSRFGEGREGLPD